VIRKSGHLYNLAISRHGRRIHEKFVEVGNHNYHSQWQGKYYDNEFIGDIDYISLSRQRR
jgi:hypothetical protein